MSAPRAPITIVERPQPDLAPGGALLHTVYSEVCGTDVHLWHGRLAGVPYPIVPGHVSVGRLAEATPAFRAYDGGRIAEGDLVVFYDVHRACGHCEACAVTHTPTRCPSRRVYGITDGAADGLFGGWAEAIYLEPGVVAAPLPASVTPEAYIGGGCGLVTAVHAVERARVQLADTVLVQGVGAVGLSCIALAKLSGAARVIAIGAPDNRLALAARMGADLVLPLEATTLEERRERVLDATGRRGVDVAIEAAGSPRAIEEVFDLVRDGGAYVVAGHYTDVGPSRISGHHDINRKHLEIRGCWGSQAGHFVRALRILEHHAARIPWDAIGEQTFALDDMTAALEAAEAMRFTKGLVAPNGLPAR